MPQNPLKKPLGCVNQAALKVPGDERIEHSEALPKTRIFAILAKTRGHFSWEIYLNILSVNIFNDLFFDSSSDFLYMRCITDGVAHPPIDIISASGIPNE